MPILETRFFERRFFLGKRMMSKSAIFVLGLFLLLIFSNGCRKKENSEGSPITLRVGHVGHDHHLALYVALDHFQELTDDTEVTVRPVRDQSLYKLYDGERKVADLEIVRVGGGAKMPTALSQGIIDVGFGGVAPVLASCDRGAPVKLIAPLHTKGNLLVVHPDQPIDTWDEFLKKVEKSDVSFRMGYKSPMAVAKMIFEDALRHEGVAFSGDAGRTEVQVHMINLKKGGNLNTSLSQGLVDGYVGNNPFPSIAMEKGIGKIVCDLENLPPERFRDHPCCCLAANPQTLQGKRKAVTDLLVLLILANERIHQDPDAAVASACRWIGTSEEVERASIPTSGYSLQADEGWHDRMGEWFKTMNDLETFQGRLKGLQESEAAGIVYDLGMLQRAEKRIERENEQD